MLVWTLAPSYARCASVVTNWTNKTYSLPSGEGATGAPTGFGFTISGMSPSIGEQRPSLKNRHLFCVVVRLFGRFTVLALADGKRNLREGMSAERPVRQRSRYAWAYDGVMAARSRILPSMQYPNSLGLSELCWWLLWFVHKSVNNPHNHNPMLEASM